MLPLSLMRCHAAHNQPEKRVFFAWEVFNAPFWRSEVLALQEAADFLKDKNQELAEILAGPAIQIFRKTYHRSDRKRREALAFLLGLVLKHGAQTDQGLAHEKAFVELGDTGSPKSSSKSSRLRVTENSWQNASIISRLDMKTKPYSKKHPKP